jgi:hypothetical protein
MEIHFPKGVHLLIKDIVGNTIKKKSRIYVFSGPGSSGKTTVMDAISRLFRHIIAPPSCLTDHNKLSKIVFSHLDPIVLIRDVKNPTISSKVLNLMNISNRYFIIETLPNKKWPNTINVIHFTTIFVDNPDPKCDTEKQRIEQKDVINAMVAVINNELTC